MNEDVTTNPRLGRKLALAAGIWMLGACCSAYLILAQGEAIGATVMGLGAQLRNAAATPDVRVESEEPFSLADYVPPPLPPKPKQTKR